MCATRTKHADFFLFYDCAIGSDYSSNERHFRRLDNIAFNQIYEILHSVFLTAIDAFSSTSMSAFMI